MSSDIKFTLTDAGFDAGATAFGSGTSVQIINVLTGTTAFAPLGNETTLPGFEDRFALAEAYEQQPGQWWFRVRCEAQSADDGGYMIKSLGLELQDGTLLGLWSAVDTPGLAWLPAYGEGYVEIEFPLVMNALPAGSVTVQTSGESQQQRLDVSAVKGCRAAVMQFNASSHLLLAKLNSLWEAI